MSEITLRQAARAIRALAPMFPISIVYIFGSHVRGAVDDKSDLDIAVLAHGDLSPSGRHKLRLGFMQAVAQRLHVDVSLIDVVILQDAPILLEVNAALRGLAVYDSRPHARLRYQMQVQQRYDAQSSALDEDATRTLHRLISRQS